MKSFKFANSILCKIMLYISAFIPMYLLLLIKFIVEIINSNLSFNILNSLMLFILFFLTIFGSFGVFVVLKRTKLKQQNIKITSFQNSTDQYFLSYFSLFVLFSLTFELEKFSMAIVFIIILTLIGFVYIKNNLYYINPFLNILGFSFYNITIKDENGKNAELKVFHKGKLESNKTYNAKIGISNFIIVDDN